MKIKDNTKQKKVKIRLPLHRKIRILLVIILCLISEHFIISYYHNTKQKEIRYKAEEVADNISKSITVALQNSLTSTQIIKNLYLEYDEDFLNTFIRICKRFSEDDITIGSLYIAPDGIIKYSYPYSVVNSTTGFNMLEDPIQKDKALLAIKTKQTTLAGPYNLIEGGTGFIIRNPIFVDGEFKAFSIVVIDKDALIEQINKFTMESNNNYKIGFRKNYDPNIILDEKGYFYKNCDGDISDLTEVPFYFMNDTWNISIEPQEGWGIGKKVILQTILVTFLFLIFIFVVIYYQYNVEAKLYAFEHDNLTGLLTRSAVHRRMRKIFKENPEVEYDVLVADVKNFKMINGIHGIKKCDELLCYLADVFSTDMPDSICGRYGGDIFILYYPNYMNKGISYFLNKAKETIDNAPIPNVVIKYGYYGKVDKSIPVNLISDHALMAAKSILNNYDYIVANYDGDLSKHHEQVQLYESHFQKALKNEEFKVWFQPKYDAATEKLVGAEALVRWQKPDGTMIPPYEFISLFEEDGLIVHLDEYVFRKVCEGIKFWYDRGEQVLSISVNVSRTTLHHDGIISKYKKIMEETGIPLDSISLEITESAAFTDKALISFAQELQDAGFILDMDDFGTGSSSLASLNILPFSAIKLDKSLIDFIGKEDGNELLRHTIELAHFKKMKVVAEGVETKDQLDFLKSLDCDVIQGYYFSKPLCNEDWLDCIIKNVDQKNIF